MRLDIYFEQKVVSDAVINETISAFAHATVKADKSG
jgi:hypothetical protein